MAKQGKTQNIPRTSKYKKTKKASMEKLNNLKKNVKKSYTTNNAKMQRDGKYSKKQK